MPSWAATALPGYGGRGGGERAWAVHPMCWDPTSAAWTAIGDGRRHARGDRGRGRGRGMRRGRLVLGSLLRAKGRGRRWRLGG